MASMIMRSSPPAEVCQRPLVLTQGHGHPTFPLQDSLALQWAFLKIIWPKKLQEKVDLHLPKRTVVVWFSTCWFSPHASPPGNSSRNSKDLVFLKRTRMTTGWVPRWRAVLQGCIEWWIFFHQKLNGTESQRTLPSVSCETVLLDTQVFFRGPWNVGPTVGDSLEFWIFSYSMLLT